MSADGGSAAGPIKAQFGVDTSGGHAHQVGEPPIQLLITSDTRLLRESIAEAFRRREGVSVIGMAPESASALALAIELRPDVLLLDMAMRYSLDAVRSITAAAPDVKIVAFAMADAESEVLTCIEAGAVGYVPRHASGDDLVAAVVSVGRGETLCSPRLASLSRGNRSPISEVHLTQREREIGVLIDQGLSNKEIARQLCIELATVKNHVHNILEKLQVARRWQAAACIRDGLPLSQRRTHTA
jgi:DNA-binding NarL/FixJ family response regulator